MELMKHTWSHEAILESVAVTITNVISIALTSRNAPYLAFSVDVDVPQAVRHGEPIDNLAEVDVAKAAAFVGVIACREIDHSR